MPSASNTPRPVPSGSRRLCTARLSDASSSQNVARTRSGTADSPNSRHISDLLRGGAAQRPPSGAGVAVEVFGDDGVVARVVAATQRVQAQPGGDEGEPHQRLPPADEQQ